MTTATLRDVLQPAIAGHYAVAGLVVLGWEDASAYVEAAEELGVPVILQAGPGCRKYTPVPILGKMFRTLAEAASVPVVCHIDHAFTLQECQEGIDNGFTSVMIDGSSLEIDRNIELTVSVVEAARRGGVSVEGEVGYVGYASGGQSCQSAPDDAQRFDRESGADALAVSIGNVHLQQNHVAGIDFDILHALEKVTHLPLVLHGGSGIPPDVRRRLARETRVKKINIGTELRMAFGKALRQSLRDQPDVFDRISLLSGTVAHIRHEAKVVLQALKPEEGGDSS